MYDVYRYSVHDNINPNTLLLWNGEFIFFPFPLYLYFPPQNLISRMVGNFFQIPLHVWVLSPNTCQVIIESMLEYCRWQGTKYFTTQMIPSLQRWHTLPYMESNSDFLWLPLIGPRAIKNKCFTWHRSSNIWRQLYLSQVLFSWLQISQVPQ